MAPGLQPDTLNDPGVTVIRTPGAILNDFRTLKPMAAP